MSKQWSPPTHTKDGYSYELEGRQIADRLSASELPYGWLVAAARDCLRNDIPPRDATVIAGAKRYRDAQLRAVNGFRARSGLPPVKWGEEYPA